MKPYEVKMDSYGVQPTPGHPTYQSTVKLKVLSLFVLLVIALIGGAVPLCLVRDVESNTPVAIRRNRRIRRAVSIMNSFSGGVFLGIALVHLIPSVRSLITEALEAKSEREVSEYPWAELIASAGFFFIVMVEQVLQALEEKFGSSASFLHHSHSHTEDNSQLQTGSNSSPLPKEEEAEREGLQLAEPSNFEVSEHKTRGQKLSQF